MKLKEIAVFAIAEIICNLTGLDEIADCQEYILFENTLRTEVRINYV